MAADCYYCPSEIPTDGETRALQDCPGHSNLQRTVRCTKLSPTRFKDFWRE
jgi:hypothetical protein